jgi:hypothetical protein
MCPVRCTVLRVSLALALALVLAGAASAQYREFTGKVDEVDEQRLTVDNRMGDTVTFERLDATRVSGQDKQQWRDLEKSDWVTVHWKMVDKPRKAYRVDVLPPKEGAGDDR